MGGDHLWEAIGAIGEIVGALAVVLTLVYLAIQLRLNTKSTNSNSSNNVMEGFNAFNTTLFSDPELVRIYYLGLQAPDSLSPDQQQQFGHMAACLMNIYRNLYHQYAGGTFQEQYWMPWAREAQQLMGTPGIAFFRTITGTYEDLFAYLKTLPDGEEKPLSKRYFPASSDNPS